MRIFLVLIFLINILAADKDNIIVKDSVFSAEIKRDDWGVPHIYGKKDADVSFGLAYAHAQDDYATLEDVIFALRGELASIYGRNAAVNDYYAHLMNYWGMIEDRYESDVADDVKLICEGYASGINKFLEDNPDLKKRSFDLVTAKDIIVGFSHRMPLMFGLDGVLKKLAADGNMMRPDWDTNKGQLWNLVLIKDYVGQFCWLVLGMALTVSTTFNNILGIENCVNSDDFRSKLEGKMAKELAEAKKLNKGRA